MVVNAPFPISVRQCSSAADLHFGNLAMAVPTEAFDNEIWETLPGTQFTPVVPWDLSQSGKHLPAYLLSPLSVLDDIIYGKEEELMNGSVKIVDFGNG